MDKKTIGVVGVVLFALGAVTRILGEVIGGINGARLIQKVGRPDPEELIRAMEVPNITVYGGAALAFIGVGILTFVIFKLSYRKKWMWWWILVVSILYFSYLSLISIIFLVIRRKDFLKNEDHLIKKIDEMGKEEGN